MPPRYAYWTIIIDDQPTAFRAGALDDLMPTFNRLKEKQPSAKLMWFQGGKLWPSRIDAREAMQVRGERGREKDPRQRESRPHAVRPFSSGRSAGHERPVWKPKDSSPKLHAPIRGHEPRPEWKPKGSISGPPSRSSKPDRHERPVWKPKASLGAHRATSSSRGDTAGKPQTKANSEPRLEWRPKVGVAETPAEKRRWVPKAEYKKTLGTEAKRDEKWRPGGEHKDPRQKYKDAKKAKWTRFKQAIRTRATKKRGGER